MYPSLSIRPMISTVASCLNWCQDTAYAKILHMNTIGSSVRVGNFAGLAVVLSLGVSVGPAALCSRNGLAFEVGCKASPNFCACSFVQHHRTYNCDDGD